MVNAPSGSAPTAAWPSNSVRPAGIPADVHVTEAAGHGGFFGMAPEDEEVMREIRRFVDRHWGTKAAGSNSDA